MSVVTTTYLKSRFESGDFPNAQDFIDLIDTLGAGTSYKKYTALLTQTGTNAPVATILENTLSGTPVWTYGDVGYYICTLSGVFIDSKTTIRIGQEGNLTIPAFQIQRIDSNSFGLFVSDDYAGAFGTGDNGALSNTSIEIRVYP